MPTMNEDGIDPANPWKKAEPEIRPCAFDGCGEPGEYRAPRSPGQLDSYIWFCLEHVREYNKAWNYYAGMNEEEIEAQIRYDTVWQRPTWPMGDRAAAAGKDSPGDWRDVFDMFEEAKSRRGRYAPPLDHAPTDEDRAFVALDLDSSATLATVKARYKELVKRYHPDANGGDKAAEEKFKQISLAYATLSAGMVT